MVMMILAFYNKTSGKSVNYPILPNNVVEIVAMLCAL